MDNDSELSNNHFNGIQIDINSEAVNDENSFEFNKGPATPVPIEEQSANLDILKNRISTTEQDSELYDTFYSHKAMF